MSRITYLAILITIAVVIVAATTTILYHFFGTPSTTTTTTTTSTISTTSTTGLKEEYNKLLAYARKLRLEGYDTIYAEYLLLSAYYHYNMGSVDEALKLLSEAEQVLNNTSRLPETPRIKYNIVDNTLYIRKKPSPWDFVPLGTVFVLSSKGYLAYPSNDLGWKLSCFIIVAWGKNGSKWFAYQGRLPLAPWESVFRPRVFIKGKWHVINVTFAGPLYYDNGSGGIFDYPTVYEYDLSGKIMEYLTYIPENRTWVHGIIDVAENKTILVIRAHGIGVPMWLGSWNNSYLIHGVYAKSQGLDLWSGFWEVGIMTATINLGGYKGEFRGVFVFDRASHHVYGIDNAFDAGGLVLSFSSMVIHQDDLDIMITVSENPSPMRTEKHFEHQLRINMLHKNITIDTVDFELEDDGGLQPHLFTLQGRIPDGYINLTGKVVSYWPPKWPRAHGAWWNDNVTETWGRAFIHWKGIIVYGGETIRVDALGAGEFTRYAEGIVQGNFTCRECCWYDQPCNDNVFP